MKIIAKENLRIDKYLINELNNSRSKIQRMIDSKNILVNNNPVKNSYTLHIGDEITINEDYTEIIDMFISHYSFISFSYVLFRTLLFRIIMSSE